MIVDNLLQFKKTSGYLQKRYLIINYKPSKYRYLITLTYKKYIEA